MLKLIIISSARVVISCHIAKQGVQVAGVSFGVELIVLVTEARFRPKLTSPRLHGIYFSLHLADLEAS